MGGIGDEIAEKIAADIADAGLWPAVGNAVAEFLGRISYYISGAASGTFPQSLQGTPPELDFLSCAPSASAPAYLAQAATPSGTPNLSVWPAHQSRLHVVVRAPFLPAFAVYGVVASLSQVDGEGSLISVIAQWKNVGEPYYTGNLSGNGWQELDIPIPLPQFAVDPNTRLLVQLQAVTSSTTATEVDLMIGDGTSYIDTSLIAAGGGAASDVVCSTAMPLPDAPVGDPGGHTADKRPPYNDHVHPLVPPDTYGGKLWTGLVPNLLAHPPCDAVFHEQGGCDPSVFGTMWSEIATGVWRRNVVGHILGATTDDVGAFVGMRLFAWSAGVELAHTGPYVLDDIGMDPVTHADTYPQMHRADDFASTAQVLHGAWFNITGGTAWGGHAFRLTNADPVGEIDVAALVWEIVDPLTAAPTDELLTAAQLSLASPTTTIASQNVSSGSGEVELVVCTEHDAALAGTTLPGDKPWRFHLFCCLIGSDDPAATTVINCYLRGSLDAAWHLVATTQSLHNTVYGMMVEAGTLGADYAMGAGEKLQARFTAASTSTIGQTVGLVFNDAAHSTFIDVPVTIGNAGTDDHNQLTNRFRRNNLTLPVQHDAEAVDPPEPKTVTTVNGFLTLPSNCTTVVQLMGAEPLRGISLRDGNYVSIPLILFILQAETTDPNQPDRDPFRTIVNDADMTGHAGFCGISLGMGGLGRASSTNPPPNLELPLYSCLQLICMGGDWRPVAPAFVYTSP